MNSELAAIIEDRSTPVPESGCWIWLGTIGKGVYNRYGTLSYKGKRLSAHRASYLAFVGPIPEKHYICHHCDTPECVNPSHLFCGTPRDNALDMRAKGRRVQSTIYGERNGAAKLTAVQVREIRALHGTMMQKDIAEKYGVDRALIRQIVRRDIWKHV